MRHRLRGVCGCGVAVLALAGCATPPGGTGDAGGRAAATVPDALPVLRREDSLWLERVNFGLDSASVADYRRLGRERYLEGELDARAATMPALVAAQIDALEVSHVDSLQVLGDADAQRKAANALPDGPDREAARKALNDHGNALATQAIQRDLLRAVYSSDPLREQMLWFWLNHFSVHQYKADLRWVIGDYSEHAIRPHVFGHFRELVLATLEHPAMLQYLDNDHNAAGHVNENYARELLELHTLGVGSGYTQEDVQQLALILTGVGVNASGNVPKLKPELQSLYRRHGAFEFNPAKHDFSQKVFLGRRITGRGFAEVEEAVDLIVRQPACAHFIARELATYFIADTPPPALVERMARSFMKTDGDIAAVLRTMLLSREVNAALGEKFKDPMRFVISAVRFAYDGRPITNSRPMLNWLNSLGEAPYGRQTPDGYPLTELNWASSGQMSRRFEIARAIGSGSAGLFDPDAPAAAAPAAVAAAMTPGAGTTPPVAPGPAAGTTPPAAPIPAAGPTPPAPPIPVAGPTPPAAMTTVAMTTPKPLTSPAAKPAARGGFPQLSNRLYFEAVEPYLTARTRDALNRATSPQEWNTFLLCSPEFSYE
jgi:uncharacterized protein (DUF1800 family)